MNARLQALLSGLPSGIGVNADAVPSLTLDGTGGVVLNDLTLYVTSTAENTSATIDLHHTTVQALLPQLPTGVTGTVTQDGMAELLICPTDQAPLPTTLTIATNPLWQWLGAISRALTTQSRSQAQVAGMLNPRAASGIWLDVWAATLGVTRHAGEPDSLFLIRMAGQTLEPVVNNTAIAQLLGALGYPTTVVDTAPWHFTANIDFPTYQPNGFAYTQAQLAAIIADVQALGVQAIVNFLNTLSEGAALTDTVSTAQTEDSAVGWGAVDWGAFAWV